MSSVSSRLSSTSSAANNIVALAMNESRTLRVRLFQFTIKNSRFTIIFFVAAFAHHWRVGGAKCDPPMMTRLAEAWSISIHNS